MTRFVVGERVVIPWLATEMYEVRCEDGDEVWLLDLRAGGRLTVKADCVERAAP